MKKESETSLFEDYVTKNDDTLLKIAYTHGMSFYKIAFIH